MRDDTMARAAMEEELGNRRQDTLPLDDREAHNRPAYQPSRVKVVQNADSMRVSNKWKDRINAGAFNDSDAAAVRDLADLGGPRAYDRNARRLNVRPPPPSQIVTRSSPASSIMSQASCPAVRLPPPSWSMGQVSRPIRVRLPPSSAPESSTSESLASQQAASDTKAQVGIGRGNLTVPAPSRSGKVNVPPTPAASPTAPVCGVLTAKPAPAGNPAATSVSQPKPGCGLRASRWAADDGELLPATNSQIQESENVPVIETKVIERQDTPQSCTSDAQVRETTRALSELKIYKDEKKVKVTDDTKARIEPHCIDPLTGERLGQEFVVSGKAWLFVNRPDGKRRCGLYLRVWGEACPVFDVVVPGERKATHNLLHMLSQTRGGVFLDLAFRLPANRIIRYNFELGTEEEASEFLEGIEDLRELTVQALSNELTDLADASFKEIGDKLNARPGYARSIINITAVTYPFPAPIRKTFSVKSEAKRTETVQGILIPQADGPSPKSQRRTYTQEELTSLRNEESNIPLFRIDDDFIRGVKRRGHKRTDSEECVVGMTTEKDSRSADVAPPTAVLGKLRQMMSDDRTWVSRRGEKAL